MKKIIVLMCLVAGCLMCMSISFAENLRAFKPYEVSDWMTEEDLKLRYEAYMEEAIVKGYMTNEEKNVVQKYLDEYTDLVYYNVDLNEHLTVDEKIQAKKELKQYGNFNVLVDRDGRTHYVCYSIEHIEVLIELFMYDLIEVDDELLNLSSLATRSGFISAYVTMLGVSDEELIAAPPHVLIGVPETANKYVNYAYAQGWLNDYVDETVWDDTAIDSTFYTKVSTRALNNGLESDKFGKDLIVKRRVGTYCKLHEFDPSYNKVLWLEAGEPVRNSDIISIMSSDLKRCYCDHYLTVQNKLLYEGKLSYDVFDYINAYDFFRNAFDYGYSETIAQKMHFYGWETPISDVVLRGEMRGPFKDRENPNTVIGRVQFQASRESTVERVHQETLHFLVACGVSEQEARSGLTKALNGTDDGLDLTASDGTVFHLYFNTYFKTLWIYVSHSQFNGAAL